MKIITTPVTYLRECVSVFIGHHKRDSNQRYYDYLFCDDLLYVDVQHIGINMAQFNLYNCFSGLSSQFHLNNLFPVIQFFYENIHYFIFGDDITTTIIFLNCRVKSFNKSVHNMFLFRFYYSKTVFI